MSDHYPRYKSGEERAPLPNVDELESMTVFDRRVLTGRGGLTPDLLSQLLVDTDFQVRSAAIEHPNVTSPMLASALEVHPEHRQRLVEHDRAPISIMADRPVAHTGTDIRLHFVRSMSANEKFQDEYVTAASELPLDDVTTTLGDLLDRLDSSGGSQA